MQQDTIFCNRKQHIHFIKDTGRHYDQGRTTALFVLARRTYYLLTVVVSAGNIRNISNASPLRTLFNTFYYNTLISCYTTLFHGKYYFVLNHLFHQKKIIFYLTQKNFQTIIVVRTFQQMFYLKAGVSIKLSDSSLRKKHLHTYTQNIF